MFINPIMLAGLAGAAVPLVLHLLNRARYRNVQWGAMMFLDSAKPQQEQNTRLRQSAILGIRMLMVGLLAAALARPVLHGPWAAGGDTGPLSAGIIIDCSPSMSLSEQDRPRLDQAREAAIQILSRLHSGDEAFVLPLGGIPPAQPRPTVDLQSVASQVMDLQNGWGGTDLADGLVQAADLLSRHGRGRPKLYLITDRQAVNWAGIDEAFAARWAQVQSSRPAELTVIVVGSEDHENVAVEALTLARPPAVAGRPAEVEVRVRNYGRRARSEMPLVLSVDEQEVYRTMLNLPAGQQETVRAPVMFQSAGERRLTVAVEASGVRQDNRLDAVVNVIDPIPVLIVSGDERSGAFRSESDFLRLALAPYRAAGLEGDMARVEVMPAERWEATGLEAYRVLVLANVPQLTAAQVRAVEHFVHGGGGLLIAPGNLTRADIYNRTLYRDGEGIMPAALEPAVAGDGSRATAVLGLELDHPVFHFLRDRPDPVPAATIGRFFPTSSLRAEARVLSRYVTGDAFLIELSAGRGRVLLMTTPVDADWSTLPMTGFYLPFAQSMTHYLAAGGLPQRNVPLGRPLHLSLPPAEGWGEGFGPVEEAATVTLPSGRRQAVGVSRQPEGAELSFSSTYEPGFYAVELRSVDGEGRTNWFAVQPPIEQSDLTPLTDAQWRDYQQMLGFTLIDAQWQDVAAALAEPKQRWELWGLLMAAVIAMAVLEMALARAWGGRV